MRVARSAGIAVATAATANRTAAAAANVTGSTGEMPNSSPLVTRRAAAAPREPERRANRGHRQALAQHQAEHRRAARADRDADSELHPPFGDEKRDDAVDADDHEREAAGGEHDEQQRRQSLAARLLIDDLVERLHLSERQIRTRG